MIHFAFIEALFLLILAPLFLVVAWVWLCRAARRMKRLSRHAENYPKHARLQLILIFIGLVFAIFALARPHWGKVDNPAHKKQILQANILIAVDVSRSMLANDISPTRLDFVKTEVLDFLDKVGPANIGLIAFRGEAEVLCPLTSDKKYLKTEVEKLDPHLLRTGDTNLADPIATALQLFEAAKTKQNILLLITDGESHSGDAVQMAKHAGEKHIVIFPVGIGAPKGTPLVIDGKPVKWMDETGREVVVQTQLNEPILKQIAQASRGHYIPLATSQLSRSSLFHLYQHHLRQLDFKDASTQVEQTYHDRTWIFLVVAILAGLMAAALSLGRVSFAHRKAACLLFGGLIVGPLVAATAAREAQAAYEAGDYQTALQHYVAALNAPNLEPLEVAQYTYNKAFAQWRLGQLHAALQTLDTMPQQPLYDARVASLRAHLMYAQYEQQPPPTTTSARIQAQQQLQRHQDVVEAYTRALQLNPNDPTAKANLSRLLAAHRTLQNQYTTAEEAARKEEIENRFKEVPLDELTQRLLKQQHDLIEQIPSYETSESPSAYLETIKTFADKVQQEADGWYYLAHCAEEKLDQLLPPTEDKDLQAQQQQARQQILQHARETYPALDTLAGAYRSLQQTTAHPLMPIEATAYRMWQTFASPQSLLDEAIRLREHLATQKAFPIYDQQRNPRQEARAMEQRIAEFIDQCIAQPQQLSPEVKEEIKPLNEALKASLQQPEDPTKDQAKHDRLVRLAELLKQNQQQQNQDQNQQQDQQQSQDQNQQQQQGQNQQNQQQQQGQNQQQDQQQQGQNQQQDQSQAQQQEASSKQDEAQAEASNEDPAAAKTDATEAEEQQEATQAEESAASKETAEADEGLSETMQKFEDDALLRRVMERAEAYERLKREAQQRGQPARRQIKDW